MTAQPNILFIVSDQERQRDWLPAGVDLPNRQRLIDRGLEFTQHYTHSSPCSPSRATLMTGQYVMQHRVDHNVIAPSHRELDPSIPTLGHVMRRRGYRSSYIGKWHLSQAFQPDMDAYGYSDWNGNDRAFMGWAGTGCEYDPPIADQAVAWLSEHANDTQPWFCTVALVNPHDVMWFPIDQPEYQAAHPKEVARTRRLLEFVKWKEGEVLPAFPFEYEEWFDTLPANFDDDLHTKPEVHRQWLYDQQHAHYGYIDPSDTKAWLRHLDYYVKLHQLGDESLGRILAALDATGRADDTVIVFTSDHGDMCGSHGLRSKGPFNYQEIMHIPLYVTVPGQTTAGSKTDALTSSVDLASTIAAVGGAGLDDTRTFSGHDLAPLFADQNASVRDHVMFTQDMAWYDRCIPTRYASRGIFDGRHKYCRYYGVGGSTTMIGEPWPTPKLFDYDAAFEEHDHEWYDLQEDPHELVNLAHDRGRRQELRARFDQLVEAEHAAWGSR
jgi:arylsulfatase A-like enzyme